MNIRMDKRILKNKYHAYNALLVNLPILTPVQKLLLVLITGHVGYDSAFC